MTFSFFRFPVGAALLAAGALIGGAALAQPVYVAPPAAVAPPVAVGNQVMVPMPQPAYNVSPLYAQPVYPAAAYPYPYPYPYAAPVVVQPAPVYMVPPLGVSIGFGGGWRRRGWGMGVRF